ncbi:MAG: glutamate--tRNA ligase family protein, partial [Phycisphaerales bacterium JB059]
MDRPPRPPSPQPDPQGGSGPLQTTRLAPSPTGALHLGNARSFLVNWALARQQGWRIVLRIEDLDTPRVKPGAIEETIDTLRWLGLDWDEGPIIQSHHITRHADAMRHLAARGLVYPCELTRSQIEQAANAPHEGDREAPFPPALRPDRRPDTFDDTGTNWRFIVEPGEVTFTDAFAGAHSADPALDVGDFVVWTKRACPAYQLAVLVDDFAQGVTQVVRGNDLLPSTARQILLARALGPPTPPPNNPHPPSPGPHRRPPAQPHPVPPPTHNPPPRQPP